MKKSVPIRPMAWRAAIRRLRNEPGGAVKAENAHPEPQPVEVSEFRQPQHFSIVHDCGGKGIIHFSLERDQISQEVLCLLQLECTSCHELECFAKASQLEQTP